MCEVNRGGCAAWFRDWNPETPHRGRVFCQRRGATCRGRALRRRCGGPFGFARGELQERSPYSRRGSREEAGRPGDDLEGEEDEDGVAEDHKPVDAVADEREEAAALDLDAPHHDEGGCADEDGEEAAEHGRGAAREDAYEEEHTGNKFDPGEDDTGEVQQVGVDDAVAIDEAGDFVGVEELGPVRVDKGATEEEAADVAGDGVGKETLQHWRSRATWRTARFLASLGMTDRTNAPPRRRRQACPATGWERRRFMADRPW